MSCHADIHSVSPREGSTQGGTLITVSGSGFGTSVSDIEVDVDGIPCQVMSHNMTHIQCWTGRPHDNDLSVADSDGGYSVTESGHRFRGDVHSHTVIHPFFHASTLSQHRPLHLYLAYTHFHILSFCCTPILSFSHSVIHSFSHSLIHVHSFSRTLRFTRSQFQALSQWFHKQLKHST